MPVKISELQEITELQEGDNLVVQRSDNNYKVDIGEYLEQMGELVYTKTEADGKFVAKESGKSLVSNADIEQITTNKNDITSLQTGKQNTLIAGENITINENVISASGVTSYNDLSNKPKINNVELSGNKSASDLGLQENLSLSVVDGKINITYEGE